MPVNFSYYRKAIDAPRILLAPMEGVVDSVMRDLLTRLGGFDLCATEFIRVTSQLLPPSVFFRFCPELRTRGRTPAGVPVFVQLLGGSGEPMAENAARAAELGALGIDLNFGCPAKTVNRNEGGAVLLKTPERVRGIVEKVRAAVPAHLPVSVKMRLGFDTPDNSVEIAQAIEAGGASWLTVHARTRMDGYRPPARWEWLARIREGIHVPLVANGEMWSVEDYERCRAVSGCQDVMLGRGVIARPDLARQIRQATRPLPWEEVHPLVLSFFKASQELKDDHHGVCRTKQWLRLLARNYSAAGPLFEEVKTQKTGSELSKVFAKAVRVELGKGGKSERRTHQGVGNV